MDLQPLLDDLKRACGSSEYTYLYANRLLATVEQRLLAEVREGVTKISAHKLLDTSSVSSSSSNANEAEEEIDDSMLFDADAAEIKDRKSTLRANEREQDSVLQSLNFRVDMYRGLMRKMRRLRQVNHELV